MQYMIYGAPRSGSTYLMEWLYPYLYDRCGCRASLKEFFCHAPIPFRHDGKSLLPCAPRTVSVMQRLDWLKHSPQNYLLKQLSCYDHPAITDYLRQRYHAIVLYRQNVWKHMLSYVISTNTKVWYWQSSKEAKLSAVTVKKSQFDYVMQMIVQGRRVGRSYPHKTMMAYEEFCANPYHLLDRLGLPRNGYDPYRHRFAPAARKLNHHHEATVKNIDEVGRWFREWKSHNNALL